MMRPEWTFFLESIGGSETAWRDKHEWIHHAKDIKGNVRIGERYEHS
jgi:hypothetical protein